MRSPVALIAALLACAAVLASAEPKDNPLGAFDVSRRNLKAANVAFLPDTPTVEECAYKCLQKAGCNAFSYCDPRSRALTECPGPKQIRTCDLKVIESGPPQFWDDWTGAEPGDGYVSGVLKSYLQNSVQPRRL